MPRYCLNSLFILIFCCSVFFNCSTINETSIDNNTSTPDISINSDSNILTIDTVPGSADVYINNRFAGESPVVLEDMLPGVYKVEIEKQGYKKVNSWITYNGEEEQFTFNLERIVGKISITTQPEETIIVLGGKEIKSGETTVPVGTYILDISCFGYEKSIYEVTILEDQVTRIKEELIKAYFRIDNFNLSRSVLNPDNPGLLGQVEISFQVFSFGTGKISIEDSDGKEVFKKELGRFTAWDQNITWSGKSDEGLPLPDGEYSVNLYLTDEDTGKPFTDSKYIEIDRDLQLNFLSGLSGNSGLQFTAIPRVLPKRNMQLSASFFGYFKKIDNFLVYNAPLNLLFRFGLGKNLELNFNTGIILKNSTELPYLFSTSIRFNYLKLKNKINFNSGLTGKITFINKTGDDIFTNYTGISVGNPLELKAGPFSFIINPEISISMWDITHDNTYNDDPGFYLWFYARTGILLDFGFIATGLSFAARTKAVSSDFGFDLPLHTALEINYLIPTTKLYLSATVIAEFGDDFYILGGGGLGYINN